MDKDIISETIIGTTNIEEAFRDERINGGVQFIFTYIQMVTIFDVGNVMD